MNIDTRFTRPVNLTEFKLSKKISRKPLQAQSNSTVLHRKLIISSKEFIHPLSLPLNLLLFDIHMCYTMIYLYLTRQVDRLADCVNILKCIFALLVKLYRIVLSHCWDKHNKHTQGMLFF